MYRIESGFAETDFCLVKSILPPGPLPARKASRPEGRPLWAGGRHLTSVL